MKAFARSFFALGVLTALVLLVFPDVLKFVSIPADDSMLPKTAAGPASSTTTKETSEAQAAPTIVSFTLYTFLLAC